MSFRYSCKVHFWRLAYKLVFSLGVYTFWSKVYRNRYMSRFRSQPIRRVNSLEAMLDQMRTIRWTADGFKELWDAIGTAQYVEAVYQWVRCGGKQEEVVCGHGLDCDEFAVWIAASLNPTKFWCQVLNVVWLDSDGKMHGHHVALIENTDTGRLVTMSNWGIGRDCTSFSDAAQSVCPTCHVIGYTVFHPVTLAVAARG